MAKDLTELSIYGAIVTVPEGTDSRDDAAGNVELLAQQLANRTRYLKGRADVAAYVTADQTFTGNNAFTRALTVGTADPSKALLGTAETPGVLGEAWRLLFSFALAPGEFALVYSGTNSGDTLGGFAIVMNAVYSHLNNRWEQVDAGKKSVAYLMHNGYVRIASREPGLASWLAWDASPGTRELLVLGKLECGSLDAGGAATVGGSLTVTGDVEADNMIADGDVTAQGNVTAAAGNVIADADVRALGGAVISSGEFRYLTPKARSTIIQPFAAEEIEQATAWAKGWAWWSIRLPPDAIIQTVEILYVQSTTDPCSARAHRRHSHNWVSPLTATEDIFTSDLGIAAAGISKLTLNFGSMTVDAAQEYLVDWTGANAADRATACRVIWTEVGPRHVP
jgi:hypothetical protein